MPKASSSSDSDDAEQQARLQQIAVSWDAKGNGFRSANVSKRQIGLIWSSQVTHPLGLQGKASRRERAPPAAARPATGPSDEDDRLSPKLAQQVGMHSCSAVHHYAADTHPSSVHAQLQDTLHKRVSQQISFKKRSKPRHAAHPAPDRCLLCGWAGWLASQA